MAKLLELAAEIELTVGRGANSSNFWRGRWLNFLARIEKFFKKFLAVSQTGEANVGVQPDPTREANECFGDVQDAHRAAHFEQERVPMVSDGESLQNQGHRFVRRHEETRYLRMSDGKRMVLAELLLQDRDHASVRPQHITKTHGDATHGPRRAAGNHQFPDSLGGAHDVDRIDGLIRRNKDEARATVFFRDFEKFKK